MREVPWPLTENADEDPVTTFRRHAAKLSLEVTQDGTLRRIPGSVHLHLKPKGERGTLEFTYDARQPRAWLSVQSGRDAPWIEPTILALLSAVAQDNRD